MTSRDRPIRILVADDSPTALIAICNYLKLLGQFEIIGLHRTANSLWLGPNKSLRIWY
jgi:hypothetical protein